MVEQHLFRTRLGRDVRCLHRSRVAGRHDGTSRSTLAVRLLLVDSTAAAIRSVSLVASASCTSRSTPHAGWIRLAKYVDVFVHIQRAR